MKYIYQHYVFNTYKNRYVLIDPLSVSFLYNTFAEIAKNKGFEIVVCKILGDHVHCLIKYESRHRIDYVIRMLKGISSKRFFEEFRTNRLVYRKLWARSYYAKELKGNEIPAVINYIENQINRSGFDKRFAPTLKASVPISSIKEPTISLSGCSSSPLPDRGRQRPILKVSAPIFSEQEPTVLLSG